LKELLAAKNAGGPSHSFVIGKAYLIRTVTMYYTGKLVSITDYDLVLDDAAWIADTGRFSEALKAGVLNEVEPFINPVIIPRGGIIDATEWSHALPRAAK
jgi:hypothetical protein